MAEGTKLATAYVQIMPSMLGVGAQISEAFSGYGTTSGNSFSTSFVKVLTGGAIAAAVKALASEVVESGAGFESAMSEVEAIAGATEAEITALTEKAAEMGATTKYTAEESAEALKYMAMAGWKTEDMLNGLEGVMNLAAASGEELGTVSDIVTDALTALGYSAEDSSHFADVLAAAATNSNTNVYKMGYTFQYVASLAGTMGYSMEDLAAVIGILANSGIKGEMAGTALRTVITSLVSPTDEAAKIMETLGISITDTEGNTKTMSEVVENLRTGFSGLSETEKAAAAESIAGREALSAFLTIVNTSDTDFDTLTAAIADCDGAAESMADTMNNNLTGKWTLFKSAVDGAYHSLYDQFSPALKTLLDTATERVQSLIDSGCLDAIGEKLSIIITKTADFATWLTSDATGAEALRTALSLLAVGFVAYKTAVLASTVATKAATAAAGLMKAAQFALNAVMNANPIGIMITLITAAVAAWTLLWTKCEGFRDFWIDLWNKMSAGIETGFKAVNDCLSNIAKKITGIFSSIDLKAIGKQLVQGLWNGISSAKDWVLSKIKGFGSSIVSGIKSIFGIHSPSKETAWIGEMLDRGLVSGINRYSGLVTRAIDSVAGDVLTGFGSDVRIDTALSGDTVTRLDASGTNTSLSDIARRLDNLKIYLDGNTLVGGISHRMDNALGTRTDYAIRGLA